MLYYVALGKFGAGAESRNVLRAGKITGADVVSVFFLSGVCQVFCGQCNPGETRSLASRKRGITYLAFNNPSSKYGNPRSRIVGTLGERLTIGPTTIPTSCWRLKSCPLNVPTFTALQQHLMLSIGRCTHQDMGCHSSGGRNFITKRVGKVVSFHTSGR